jgi:hypothetical protein
VAARRDGHPLVITTEDRAGHVRRLVVRGLHGATIGGLTFVALGDLLPVRGGRVAAAVIAALIALGAVTFILSPLLSRAESRGTWIVEADRVVFAPVSGRTRDLAWRDVRRVRVSRGRVELRGPRGTVRLGGPMLGAGRWETLTAAVRSALVDRFDLPRPMDAGRRWLLVRPINVAALSLVAAWLHAQAGVLWPAVLAVGVMTLQVAAAVAWSRAAPWIEPFTFAAGPGRAAA